MAPVVLGKPVAANPVPVSYLEMPPSPPLSAKVRDSTGQRKGSIASIDLDGERAATEQPAPESANQSSPGMLSPLRSRESEELLAASPLSPSSVISFTPSQQNVAVQGSTVALPLNSPEGSGDKPLMSKRDSEGSAESVHSTESNRRDGPPDASRRINRKPAPEMTPDLQQEIEREDAQVKSSPFMSKSPKLLFVDPFGPATADAVRADGAALTDRPALPNATQRPSWTSTVSFKEVPSTSGNQAMREGIPTAPVIPSRDGSLPPLPGSDRAKFQYHYRPRMHSKNDNKLFKQDLGRTFSNDSRMTGIDATSATSYSPEPPEVPPKDPPKPSLWNVDLTAKPLGRSPAAFAFGSQARLRRENPQSSPPRIQMKENGRAVIASSSAVAMSPSSSNHGSFRQSPIQDRPQRTVSVWSTLQQVEAEESMNRLNLNDKQKKPEGPRSKLAERLTAKGIKERRERRRQQAQIFAANPDRIPSESELEAAGEMDLIDISGATVKFAEVVSSDYGKKTVVVFIRHWFCHMCGQYMDSIVREIDRDILETANIDLVVIGNGSARILPAYQRVYNCPFRMYTDPSRQLYKALGMTRKTWDLGSSDSKGDYIVLGPIDSGKMVLSRTVALKTIGKPGHPSQLGGEFVFDGPLRCTYAHRMTTTRNHASIRDVVEKAGAVFDTGARHVGSTYRQRSSESSDEFGNRPRADDDHDDLDDSGRAGWIEQREQVLEQIRIEREERRARMEAMGRTACEITPDASPMSSPMLQEDSQGRF